MKMLLIAVGAVVAAGAFGQQSCGVQPNTTSRYIIGGDDADMLEFPWQVSLQVDDPRFGWDHICGGSIIDKNWILTAAHCVDSEAPQGPLRVVLGAHDFDNPNDFVSIQVIRRRRDITIHPMYDDRHLDNDFALIQLPQPLNFARAHRHLAPICLPDPAEPRVFEDMECMTSGWGLTTLSEDSGARILQKLPVEVPAHERCVRAWSGRWFGGGVPLTPRQICAATIRGEGTGVCSGDSGGPMQCHLNGRWVLSGVASFVRYCGASLYPNVYARVTSALGWIERVKASKTREP